MKRFHYLAVSAMNHTKSENLLECLLLQRDKDLKIKTVQINIKGCVLYRMNFPVNISYKVEDTVPMLEPYIRLDFVTYEPS